MKTRMFFMVVLLALVFGGIFGWKAFIGSKISEAIANSPPPVITVTATHATREVWQPKLSAIGSLQAMQGVNVTTEVAGIISDIHFKSGDEVNKGDVLLTLDAAVDLAELKGLRAQEELDRVSLNRQKELAETRATSRSQVDAARAQYELSRADTHRKMAQLAQKTIRAPFSGKLGIRRVNLGQYLSPGDEIVGLQSLDPIYVNFSLPQQELMRVQRGMEVEATSDIFPGMSFRGNITAISSSVNESTRNVMMQATLANPNNLLRPGIYAQVAVLLPNRNDVITLPQTAITYNPYGSSVFVISKQEDGSPNKVSRVFVETGATRGDQVEITQGLKVGDHVVTSGQLKLREGSLVNIDNTVTPENQPAPQVGNS